MGPIICRNCGTEFDDEFSTHCPHCKTDNSITADPPAVRKYQIEQIDGSWHIKDVVEGLYWDKGTGQWTKVVPTYGCKNANIADQVLGDILQKEAGTLYP